jgi:hypothetical protein
MRNLVHHSMCIILGLYAVCFFHSLYFFCSCPYSIQIWKLRDGPRIAIIKCEASCRVIQPAFRFRGLEHGTHNEEYTLATAYILNGDSGQLSLISPQLE